MKVIEKFHPPIYIQGVSGFIEHASFYMRIIKDFSKIAHPLCKLFEKKSKFYYYKSCLKAFGELQDKLVSAPIIISPYLSELVDVMCDESGVELGMVLG